MRVIVTGGAGFIGQHLVEKLVMKGHIVWVYDAFTSVATGRAKLNHLIGRDSVVEGRVEDYDAFSRAVTNIKPDIVFHLAAQSHVDESLDRPQETLITNAVGTQVVATVCAKSDCAMVYCSTDEVYGDIRGNGGASKEGDALNPSSPYSAGKAAGEHCVRAAGRSFNLRYAITRACNAFGLNQYPEKLIPIACKMISQRKPIPLHGGGEQIRQWIHVKDFVQAMYLVGLALHDGSLKHTTYNISGPTSCTVKSFSW